MMRARFSREKNNNPFGDIQSERSPYVGNLSGVGGFVRSVSLTSGDIK